MNRLLFSLLALATIFTTHASDEITITVAADGSGDFKTVAEAARKLRGDLETPARIIIKNGVYKEKVTFGASLRNVTVEGENRDSVIITYGDYASLNNMGTSNSFTVKVESTGVTFRNITFENSAGPVGQAVAVYTTGDRIAFYNCRFLGNQDTLYTGGPFRRLFFKDCYIEGTTDFIFGPATAYFYRCDIYAKADSYITAASTPKDAKFGYVFDDCKVTCAPGVKKVYLGRPWRPYAATAFIRCQLPGQIAPEGWHNWGKKSNEETARYCEWGCTGDNSSRAPWAKQLTDKEAAEYADTANVLTICNTWNPE